MNFIIIGESVKRISAEVKELHPRVEWKKIAGFRDSVAHDYFGVDADESWKIIKIDLFHQYYQNSKIDYRRLVSFLNYYKPPKVLLKKP